MNSSFTEGNMIWIVMGIITLLMGILLGFVAPNLIHLVWFSAGDLIHIKTPSISNILFGTGILLLSIFCFVMYFKAKKAKIAAAVLVMVSVALLAVSITNYSVLRDERIVHNEFLSLNAEEYQWSDVEEAKLLKRNDDIPYETLVLTLNNGVELDFERGPSMDKQQFDKIDFILQSHGVMYELTNR
ncbi:hypothetical protein [Jeotgalibacillus campisalis]|uniref:DUF5673 domain-containing protein n=1 Tax=Jeotgalibacillus campisalis TaxID=220754 RepID=A0A0C2S3N9_9BACL|nr:hypothetical protein [Jeotgalibacillus campisalis]KIL48574.1 hypothetical protein KR50_13470 [Jeotgalibacillus campisalis]